LKILSLFTLPQVVSNPIEFHFSVNLSYILVSLQNNKKGPVKLQNDKKKSIVTCKTDV